MEKNDHRPPAEPARYPAELDAEAALCRIGENHTLYDKLLQAYLVQTQEESAQMEGAFRHGDLDTTVRLVHRLAGASATVGAEGIRKLALALETRLRGHSSLSDVAALFQELMDALDVLLQHLRSLPGS